MRNFAPMICILMLLSSCGSKTDLQTAREQLNAAAKRGEIDRATYNYQDNLIKELDQLINTQKAFDEARKNANANAIR